MQYGYDLGIPIPDLQVDEFGVTATLSFNLTPHHTVVPWSAVYVVASEDGRGVLYHEDVPTDVSVMARAEPEAPADGVVETTGPTADTTETAPIDTAPRPSPTRALRAVPIGGHVEEAGMDMLDDVRAAPMPVRRRKRPQLRLVK